MEKCKSPHGWAYLNKRFDIAEGCVVSFCDECGWIDQEALRLAKAVRDAQSAYNSYKAPSLHELFLPHISKEIN